MIYYRIVVAGYFKYKENGGMITMGERWIQNYVQNVELKKMLQNSIKTKQLNVVIQRVVRCVKIQLRESGEKIIKNRVTNQRKSIETITKILLKNIRYSISLF